MMSNAAPGALSMRYKLRGHSYGIVSACAAGAHAIGTAASLIQSGAADAVVTGGSEAALTPLSKAAFAALDALFPVWTIASRDESLSAVVEAATRVREAGATLVVSGSAAAEIEAPYTLPVPLAPRPLLAPLLSIVPGQLFAGALAQAKGYDADRPVGLNKVTIAR
jgi:acetyl-CoA acetyltransferase